MTTSLPLCENCGQPATVRWNVGGKEVYNCDRCRVAGGMDPQPLSVQGGWPDVLDVAEAAAYLKVDPETVRRRVRDGKIEALPREGQTAPIRIRLSALESLRPVSPQTAAPKPSPSSSGSVVWPEP